MVCGPVILVCDGYIAISFSSKRFGKKWLLEYFLISECYWSRGLDRCVRCIAVISAFLLHLQFSDVSNKFSGSGALEWALAQGLAKSFTL